MMRGQAAIAGMQATLSVLASRCDQPGAMDDLEFFLARPGALKKTPCLMTLAAGVRSAPEAAVLLYEHRFRDRGLHIFATDETTGRRTLVAPLADRAQFAMAACRRLLLEGAQCILISFRHDADGLETQLSSIFEGAGCGLRWASREREFISHLRLEESFDATLAKLGTRTRNHLRYYRRRAEKELGATFDPDPRVTREEFLELNRTSAYAAQDDIAAWRYDSLRRLSQPLLYGMRDREGRWLSLIGGRHVDDSMEMHWQMNRVDLPSQSLSTAMRSFLIEYESGRGTRRMYFEGGTTHSMSHTFVREKVTDLIVLRKSFIARLIPVLLKRLLPPDNMLLSVLEDRDLKWNVVRKSSALPRQA